MYVLLTYEIYIVACVLDWRKVRNITKQIHDLVDPPAPSKASDKTDDKLCGE
jgi:hypothetical protein